MTNEAQARSAESFANGNFFAAGNGASKHKTGDIGAGDEKNESDNGHEDVERLIELTAQFGHSRRGGRG